MREVAMVTIGVILAVVGLVWWGSQIVNEDEIALRYRWGEVDDQALNPGLHVLWPGHSLVIFDNTNRYLRIDRKEPGEEVMGIVAQTRDRYLAGIVVTLEYKFDPEKAVGLLKQYGRNLEADTRQKVDSRIESEIEMAVRHVVPQHSMDELIHNRDRLRDIILFHLSPVDSEVPAALEDVDLPSKEGQTVADLGIDVSPLTISIDVPKEYRDLQSEATKIQIERVKRQVLEEQLENQQVELQLAGLRVDIERKEAEGAEAVLAASGIGKFLEKWDGTLPASVVLGDQTAEFLRAVSLSRSTKEGSSISQPRTEESQ